LPSSNNSEAPEEELKEGDNKSNHRWNNSLTRRDTTFDGYLKINRKQTLKAKLNLDAYLKEEEGKKKDFHVRKDLGMKVGKRHFLFDD
jgi:hypothetical protein